MPTSLLAQEQWVLVRRGQWRYAEHIVHLEARVLEMAVARAAHSGRDGTVLAPSKRGSFCLRSGAFSRSSVALRSARQR